MDFVSKELWVIYSKILQWVGQNNSWFRQSSVINEDWHQPLTDVLPFFPPAREARVAREAKGGINILRTLDRMTQHTHTRPLVIGGK